MNKDNENNEVKRYISPRRLYRFSLKADGDPNKAIKIYEENIRMSAAFYPILSCFEVCMRNKINEVMIEDYGDMWLLDPRTPLQEKDRENIEKVCERLREKGFVVGNTPEDMDRIIAMLPLGFWTRLLRNGQGQPLWRSTLYRVFPNYRGNFKPLRSRMYKIWELRNRIAHHEPIIFMDGIENMREEILEVIGWMSEDVRDWAAALRE